MSHSVVPKITWIFVSPLQTVGTDFAVTVLFSVHLGKHILHRMAVFLPALWLMAVPCVCKLEDTKYFVDFLVHDQTWDFLSEDTL